ncbi:IS200/IS605 family element transposase accessory protein TnpB [Candidatus Poribacteria bacterium]|nr:IS200/IS605 family element transposase accessory protein TnpB [Candidatus Poribacteria bacterium]
MPEFREIGFVFTVDKRRKARRQDGKGIVPFPLASLPYCPLEGDFMTTLVKFDNHNVLVSPMSFQEAFEWNNNLIKRLFPETEPEKYIYKNRAEDFPPLEGGKMNALSFLRPKWATKKTKKLEIHCDIIFKPNVIFSGQSKHFRPFKENLKMLRPRQVRLKLNKSQFQHCQKLSQESAHVWNSVKNFFWRTYRKKGIWLSESSLKRYVNGKFALHSQTVQAIVEKFCDNLKTARTLRCRRRHRTDASHAENPDIRYPYKTKNWFCVHWKSSAIQVSSRYIYLSNGKGRQGIVFKLPTKLSNCQPRTIELIWRNGYWLSITLEMEGKQQVLGANTAAVDMGEIHAMTITDGKESVVISGRQLRSVKRNRNKRVAQLSRLQSRCKKNSRRWKRLQAVKSKVIAECHRRTRDLNHKITRLSVDWCIDHDVKTLAIGNVTGIAQNTNNEKRLNHKNRQKIGQWEFYKQRQYLEYKSEEVGIETVLEPENGTSKTCPKCGHKHKPKGRNYNCPTCNLKMHRDVVGACNIRTKHLTGVLSGNDNFQSPKVTYLRIDSEKSGLRSSSVAGVNRRER